MAASVGSSMLQRNDPRWELINAEQDAEQTARVHALSVAERLDRGVILSRTAAELRRAAWEAGGGRAAA